MSDEAPKKRRRRRRRRPRRKSGQDQGAEPQADGQAKTAGGPQGKDDGGGPDAGGDQHPSPKQKRKRRRRRKSGQDKAGGQQAEGDRPKRQPGGRKSRQRKRGRNKSSGKRPRRSRKSRNWWTVRWAESLEGIQVGRRLARGLNYARQGRVIELGFEKGFATALVQGSRDAPYLVRMQFARLAEEDWKRVLHSLGEDLELGGGLFRGEFPPQTDEAFSILNLSIFPSGRPGDLKAACSCPDEANPCKHVAAVYYALGQEIDRDPFQLFCLRGLDRTELMEALVRTPAARAALVVPPPSDEEEARAREERQAADATALGDALLAKRAKRPTEEPLAADPRLFWDGPEQDPKKTEVEEISIPRASGALARRLGGFPFWRDNASSNMLMDQIYLASSLVGLSIFRGEAKAEEAGQD